MFIVSIFYFKLCVCVCVCVDADKYEKHYLWTLWFNIPQVTVMIYGIGFNVDVNGMETC